MAQLDIITPIEPADELPVVCTITLSDLKDALEAGLDDFRAMPTHVVFLGMIYPVVGLLIGRATFGYDIVPLLYPLAAGFTLLGPLAAVGLYELSRRREAGMDTSWRHAFDIVHSPSFKSILALGGMLLILFLIWIAIADALYIGAFGYGPAQPPEAFLRDVLTTPEGLRLAIVGNLVGALFAIIVLAVSVVSFPLMLDRHVSVAAAMLTSVRTVVTNPVPMAAWGLIVAALLLAGSIPLFLGLAIVVPVLGHATWHLYRKLVAPDPGPRPEYHPTPKGVRYAAEFPSSLFVSRPPPAPQ